MDKSKNYAALPGQPYLFTTIQSEPDNTNPRRSSRIRNSKTISLRHANIPNRFTCLLSDDSDDSSIPNDPSAVLSPTDQEMSTIYNTNAATDDYQVYLHFPTCHQLFRLLLLLMIINHRYFYCL